MILINYASALIRKERLNPTRKARGEASRNEFVKKSGVPDRVESLKKSIITRIVREPGLDLLNPSEMD